jgi:hypothetical protein
LYIENFSHEEVKDKIDMYMNVSHLAQAFETIIVGGGIEEYLNINQ